MQNLSLTNNFKERFTINLVKYGCSERDYPSQFQLKWIMVLQHRGTTSEYTSINLFSGLSFFYQDSLDEHLFFSKPHTIIGFEG